MGLLYVFWFFDKFEKLVKEEGTSWCALLLGYLQFVFYELRKYFLGLYKGFFNFLIFWVCESRFLGLKMGFSQLVMD